MLINQISIGCTELYVLVQCVLSKSMTLDMLYAKKNLVVMHKATYNMEEQKNTKCVCTKYISPVCYFGHSGGCISKC